MFSAFNFMGMDFPIFVLAFLIYSMIGWIYESTIFSLCEQGKFMNRGCFVGPYCPIYAVVSLLNLYLLSEMSSSFKIVIISGLTCCAIEYITSVVLEKLFHARYWDYSYFPLNIDGRVSVVSGLFFGFAVLLFIKTIHPATMRMLHNIPSGVRSYSAIAVLIIGILDIVFTTVSMCNLNKKCREIYDSWDNYVESKLDKINAKKDKLERFVIIEKSKNLVVKLKGVNRKFVDAETRVLKAYPGFKSTKYNAVIKKMKNALGSKSEFETDEETVENNDLINTDESIDNEIIKNEIIENLEDFKEDE